MYKLTQIDFIIFYHTTIYSTVWFQEVYGYYPVVLSAQGQSDPRTNAAWAHGAEVRGSWFDAGGNQN